MPRAQANKLYRTFTKGLITEAGFLTYPENASTDELNTVIKVKGSRSRRLGLDYEPDSVGSTLAGLTTDSVLSEYAWRGVDNDARTNFLVTQVGATIFFFNLDATPVDSSVKSFTIDLTTFASPTASSLLIADTPVQMSSGKGYLFIASEYIEPILVEYDSTADTISTLKLILQMRDFNGVDDGLSNEAQPTTLTKEHMYNLQNQGWVNPSAAGVVQGTGGTNPYTAPTPPASGGRVFYNRYTGRYDTDA